MKVTNVHERALAAPPEAVRPLVEDVFSYYPTDIAPAPQLDDERRYRSPIALWQEYDRPGAVRAFRAIGPKEVQASHWFELETVNGGTLVRHTVDGEVWGESEVLWRDRIRAGHDRVLEAWLDGLEAALP